MNEYIKKIGLSLIGLFFAGGAVWLARIDSKTFDSPEQKVKVIGSVENSPTPEQKHRDRLLDSFNNQHAIKIRQQRYEDNRRKDSIRAKTDSLFLDMVKRQTVQIEQIKEELKTKN